ncbi:putative AH/BAR domain superfamily protein [Helianthus anomalus]
MLPFLDRDGLGEACNIDFIFADALEAFGGGHDDPFVSAFREIESFKELLRIQVEHLLVDRLAQFLSDDLQATKAIDARKKLDKATYAYDQAREKVASLRRSTRDEVVTESEEVHSLVNIEATKKYTFLESLSAIMEALLRIFKIGGFFFFFFLCNIRNLSCRGGNLDPKPSKWVNLGCF